MSAPTLLGAAIVLVGLAYEPQVLTLTYPDGHTEEASATSPEVCAAAVRALATGNWQPIGGRPLTARCSAGDRFDECSRYIVGFNAPPACSGGSR